MNIRQPDKSCIVRLFWMTKSIIVNTTFMDLGDMTLLRMTLWTICRRSTTSGARKLKVSKTNGIKACWLSEHAFSCLATLLDAAFRAACPTVKALTSNPTCGETSVKSTHACFPPTHPYTITSACLSVDLLSCRSIRKFIGASFFTDTLVHLNISKNTSLTNYFCTLFFIHICMLKLKVILHFFF